MASAGRRSGGARSVNRPRVGLDHGRASREALTLLARHWTSSAVGAVVISIALALPMTFLAMLGQQAAWLESWGADPSLSVFLDRDLSIERAEHLAAAWSTDTRLKSVKIIAADDAMATISRRAGVRHPAQMPNPLPHVIVLVPNPTVWDPGDPTRLADEFHSVVGVDSVVVDYDWIARLELLMRLARRLAAVVGILLGLGAMLVVGVLIRSLIQQGEVEIRVLKLVGATDSFVRRRFLYAGTLYGVGAGTGAVIIMNSAFIALAPAIDALARSYGSSVELGLPPLSYALMTAGLGGAVGWLGAWVGSTPVIRRFDEI